VLTTIPIFAMAEKQNNVLNKNYGVNENDASLVCEFISKDLHQRHLRNESSLSDLEKVSPIFVYPIYYVLYHLKVCGLIQKKSYLLIIYTMMLILWLSWKIMKINCVKERMFLNGKVIYWTC